MPTIAQVVRDITEQLSDAVSQLVLYVIILQEQNAEVPENLLPAATGVGAAADQLVRVANAVADSGYKKYPEIYAKIVAAAQAVASAKGQLLDSVRSLGAANANDSARRSAWDNLVGACRVIAGKTVELLQIVYGAEVERLFMSTNATLEGLGSLDPKDALRDPDGFAQAASDVASQAKQVAVYLRHKAEATESPLLKENLNRVANQLDLGADNLIDDVNELLADPSSDPKQHAVDERINEVQNALNEAKRLLADAERDTPGVDSKFIDSAAGPAALGQSAREFADPETIAAAQKMADASNALARAAAAARPDAATVERAAADLENAHKNFTEKAMGEARRRAQDDPIRKRQIIGALDELNVLVPDQIQAAREAAASNGSDPELRQRIGELQHEINDAISDVAGDNARIAQAASATEKALDRVLEAAESGDKNKVAVAARDAQQANKELVTVSRDLAKKMDAANRPIRAAQLRDAADRLEKGLPGHLASAKEVSDHPNDQSAKEKLQSFDDAMRDALDDVNPASVRGAAKRAHEQVDRLAIAAAQGNKSDAVAAAKELPLAATELARLARQEAERTSDPHRARTLRDAADRLTDLLVPALNRTAVDAAGVTNEAARAAIVASAVSQLRDATKQTIDEIAGPVGAAQDLADRTRALEDAVARSGPGKSTAPVEAAMADVADAERNLSRTARNLARNKDIPPKRRAQLLADLGALDALVPLMDEQARKGATQSGVAGLAAKQKLSELVAEANKLALAVANPEAALASKSKSLKEELERTAGAAAGGDRAATQKGNEAVKRAAQDVADLARKQAAVETDASRAAALNRAADELLKAIDGGGNAFVQGATALAGAPNDRAKQDALADAHNKVLDTLQQISASSAKAGSASAGKVEQPVAAARSALDELAKAVQSKNVAAARAAGDRLKKIAGPGGELAKALREAAIAAGADAVAGDPDARFRQQDLLNAADAVEKLAPRIAATAVDAASGGNSHPFDEAFDEMQQLLDDSVGAAQQLRAAGARANQALERLRAAALGQDLAAAAAAADDLKRANARMQAAGREAIKEDRARHGATSHRAAQLEKDLTTLRQTVPQHCAQAAPAGRAVADSARASIAAENADLRNVVARVVNPEEALAAAANNEANAVDALGAAAGSRDAARANQAAQVVKHTNPEVVSLARSVAERSGPKRKDALLNAAKDLEAAGAAADASVRAASSPAGANNQDAQDKLQRVRKALDVILEEDSGTASLASSQARDVLAYASTTDGNQAAKLKRSIEERQPKVLAAARSEAAKADQQGHKAKRQVLADAADALERNMAQTLAGNKTANDIVLEALSTIAAPDAASTAADALQHLDALDRAARSNDPEKTASSGRELIAAGEQLQRELAEAADALDAAADANSDNFAGATAEGAHARANQLRAAAKTLAQVLPGAVVAAATRCETDGKNEAANRTHDNAISLARGALLGVGDATRAAPRALGTAAAASNLNKAVRPLANGAALSQQDKANLADAVDLAAAAAASAVAASTGSASDHGVAAASSADALAALILSERRAADDIVEDASNASPNIAKSGRNLGATHAKVAQALTEAANGGPALSSSQPDAAARQQELHAVAGELDQAVPGVVRAAKDIFTAGGVKSASAAQRQEVADATSRLRDAHEDALAALRSSPEDDMIALAEKLKQPSQTPQDLKRNVAALATHAALDARQYGSTPALQARKVAIGDATRKLVDAATAASKPGASQADMRAVGDAAEGVLAATEARVVASAKKTAQRARAFGAAARRGGDPSDASKRVAGGARQLGEASKETSELAKIFAQRNSDAGLRDRILQRIGEVENKAIPGAVGAAKQLLQSGADGISNPRSNEQGELARSAIAAEAAALGVVHAAKPTSSNEVQYHTKRMEAAAKGALLASKRGDGAAATAELGAMVAAQRDLERAVAEHDAHPELHDSRTLAPALREVAEKAAAFNQSASHAARSPQDENSQANTAQNHHDLVEALDKLRDAAADNTASADAQAKHDAIAAAVARLKDLLAGDDLSGLLDAANALADLMKSLLGSTNAAARDLRGTDGSVLLTDAAKEALDLLDLVAALESGKQIAPPKVSNEDVARAFQKLDAANDRQKRTQEEAAARQKEAEAAAAAAASAASSAPSSAPGKGPARPAAPEVIPEKGNFEDNMEAVAQHVKRTADRAAINLQGDDPIVEWLKLIAIELAKIATAAKEGNRQDFLVGGRTLGGHIKQLELIIRQLAGQTRDPGVQDRLFKTTEVLGNFSVQMKILVAVKAAGGGKDNSDQLVSVTRSLGYACSDTLSTVIEARLKNRR